MTKIDKKTCIGCGACIAVCPHSAISLKNGKAEIDQKKCKKCYACIDICPVKAISK
jgi:ferredoxin